MPNPYDQLYQPELPEWLNMGDQNQSPDVSPFVSALKKRMSQPKPTGPFDTQNGMSYSDMLGGSIKGDSGRGMKSL